MDYTMRWQRIPFACSACGKRMMTLWGGIWITHCEVRIGGITINVVGIQLLLYLQNRMIVRCPSPSCEPFFGNHFWCSWKTSSHHKTARRIATGKIISFSLEQTKRHVALFYLLLMIYIIHARMILPTSEVIHEENALLNPPERFIVLLMNAMIGPYILINSQSLTRRTRRP